MPYQLFLLPVIAALSAQAIKLLVDKIKGNFNLKHIFSDYGGMPSSHAAFVASLTTIIGFDQGLKSPAFAIVIVFSIIALRDALGLRRYVGEHAKTLNLLIKKLPEEEKKNFSPQTERTGHNFLEVLIGCLYGITLAIVF